MSLNTMLKDPAVLEMFRKTFPIRNENIDTKLKAQPFTRNYGLVGTAFDYLFRWKLSLINPNANSGTWVAELGVGRLQDPEKLETLFVVWISPEIMSRIVNAS